jgi:hypothetical protein
MSDEKTASFEGAHKFDQHDARKASQRQNEQYQDMAHQQRSSPEDSLLVLCLSASIRQQTTNKIDAFFLH